ncbi:MAG: GGDEF domain-containing protein [Clostridia bacterium]|nr:GGDEF domain-containing protein [Clostridia bacterium]
MVKPLNEYTAEIHIIQHVDRLLHKLWQEALAGSIKCAFFDIGFSKAFSTYIDGFLKNVSQKATTLRCKVPEQGFLRPYYPFIDFISEYLNGKSKESVDKFLEEAGVYYFQRSIFSSYYLNEVSERYEELILEELEYEKGQMLESIKSQYILMAESSPLIVVVENIHNAKQSTLDFIRNLIEKPKSKGILFIFSFNGAKSGLEDSNSYWTKFWEFVKTKSMIVNCEVGDDKQLEIEENDTNHLDDIEVIIQLSRDCFNFLAVNECREYIIEAFNRKILRNQSISVSCNFLLLQTLGDIHNYLEDNDTALYYYNSLLSFAQATNNLEEISEAYRKIGFIYLKKNNIEKAKRFCSQSLKLALEIGNEIQIFKCNLLFFLVQDKARELSNDECKELYEIISELAIRLDMKNTLSYYCTNPYAVFGTTPAEYPADESEIFNSYGIGIAEKYHNKYRLGLAYQINGMTYAVRTRYDKTFEYYKISEKIRLELGDTLELSYINNGLGYNYFQTEDYENANQSYNKALGYLKDIKDYHEMCMTFYNMAINFFFAFKHRMAALYLENMLVMMDLLNKGCLKYHSLCGIYSLIGVVYSKCGNPTKATEYLTKIKVKNLVPQPSKNEESFFLELLQGFVYKEEKKYSDAEMHFLAAQVYALNNKSDMIINMAPRFFYEFGLLYKEQNKMGNANEMFNKGLEYCAKLNYKFYKSILLKEIDETYCAPKPFKFKNEMDFRWAIEAVRKEAKLFKLHKKIQEINFLNNLQNTLRHEDNRIKLINKVITLMVNSFPVKVSFFAVRKGGRWRVVYSKVDTANIDFNIVKVVGIFAEENKEKLVINAASNTVYKQFTGSLNSIITLPIRITGDITGSILLATKIGEPALTVDDLQVLAIASNQLSMALEKLCRDREVTQKNGQLNEANKKLLKSATTDLLTGIYNRQALHAKLEEEGKRTRIYENGKCRGFSILFIDMDNFKYYNDTFGHRVGDLILYKFAEVLKSVVRKGDFLVRYGGDEFIVLLPETGIEAASLVATNIQQELIKLRQFKSEIEEFIGKRIDISEKHKLSCSIGIAEYGSDSNDMETILQQADKALYFAKHMGKNQYKCWPDVPYKFRVNEDSAN